jgi:hypothetical protein
MAESRASQTAVIIQHVEQGGEAKLAHTEKPPKCVLAFVVVQVHLKLLVREIAPPPSRPSGGPLAHAGVPPYEQHDEDSRHSKHKRHEHPLVVVHSSNRRGRNRMRDRNPLRAL